MPELRLLEQVIDVASRMMAQAEAEAFADERFSELSLRQIFHLTTILENDGITLSELARILNITRPSVTGIVTTLVSKGFVERVQDAEDRRIFHLKGTAKAREFDRVHQEIHRRMAERFAQNLNDKEVTHLARLLSKSLGIPSKP
ncbi:MAG: hypothetical protein RL318_1756 [Fibrobacterota bacterium]|jgi:DNA-binding MarR family transcriptional regulator